MDRPFLFVVRHNPTGEPTAHEILNPFYQLSLFGAPVQTGVDTPSYPRTLGKESITWFHFLSSKAVLSHRVLCQDLGPSLVTKAAVTRHLTHLLTSQFIHKL